MIRRGSVFTSNLAEVARLRQWSPSALAIRFVIVAAGLVVMLLPGHQNSILVLAMLTGIAVAAISPDRGGPALAMTAGIASWFAGSGVHGSPSPARVACFAAALYLLLSSTALAAAVPIRTRLQPRAALRWATRWLLCLGIAAALAAVSYGIGRSIDGYGYQFELAGLIGVVAVVGCAVWLFTRSPR